MTDIFSKTSFILDELGRMQGEYCAYNSDGNICYTVNYVDNVMHGETIFYFTNGAIQSKVMMVDGLTQGKSTSYYDDGRLMLECWYKDDTLHGEYIMYFDGKVVKTLYHYGEDLEVDPDTLTEQDRLYIMMSGRIPPRV